nr:hypothetical protein [Tanacetum cinerariifolium]
MAVVMEMVAQGGDGRDKGGGVSVFVLVASIKDLRVKLVHRCIATTIAGRKETTHRVTKIDLYYLYCIYTLEVICKIPYWLSKYLKGVRDKNLIYEGMFDTRIARPFGLLTNKMRDALSIKPPPHVFKKKSLIAMGIIMELKNRICVWPATRFVDEEEDAEEEAEGEDANEGAGGFAEMYQNMSQGDWQEVIEFGDSYVVPASSSSTTTIDTTSGETGTKSGRTVTLTAEEEE